MKVCSHRVTAMVGSQLGGKSWCQSKLHTSIWEETWLVRSWAFNRNSCILVVIYYSSSWYLSLVYILQTPDTNNRLHLQNINSREHIAGDPTEIHIEIPAFRNTFTLLFFSCLPSIRQQRVMCWGMQKSEMPGVQSASHPAPGWYHCWHMQGTNL